MVQKLLFILYFVGIFIFFIRPLEGDGDFYHHAAIGRYIWENHTLPHFDTFTFTAKGHEFIAYAWGSGVICHLILRQFEETGISLLTALIATLTFALLYLFLRILSIPKLTAYLFVIFCAICASIRWPNRPEIFTYLFLVILLLIDQFSHKNKKIVLLYPLVILFWANLYGAATILGLIILTLLGLRQLLIDKFRFKRNLIYLSIPLSLVAAFVNGYGWKSIFYIFYIPQIRNNVGEWFGISEILARAPGWYLKLFYPNLVIYLIYLTIAVIIISLNFKKIRSNIFYAFLALGIFLPFFSFRHAALAALLSTPILALLTDQSKLKARLLLLIFLASICSLIISLSQGLPSLKPQTVFPRKMVNFIKDNHLSGKVFNTQQLGGFLTYYLYPQILVMADTRDELFIGNSALKDQYRVLIQGQNILPVLTKYHIDLVVGDRTESTSYETLFNSKDWKVVFTEGPFFLAVPAKVVEEKNT